MSAAEGSFLRFADHEQVEQAKFFGFRSLQLKGKTFLVLYQNELVFKLADADRIAALALEGAAAWNPYGRAKQNWVQIPQAQASSWPHFFEQSRRNVAVEFAN